ncbi:MAG: bifunctional riboflavin kinase/FAD synthetase [Bacteroidota bacterium]
MKIYQSIDEFKPVEGLVVTIGTFDGFHLGHRKLLSRIVELATENNGESLVLTFFPHPRMVLRPEEHGVELLSTTTEKVELLRECGINHLVIHPFSRDFSALSASQFIQNIIVQKLQASKLVIGYDHRFGNQRTGSIGELRQSGQTLGFEVEEIPEQDIDAIAISSTRIRNALKEGRVDEASVLLGRPYSLSGIVVRGNQVGHSIGFPTANIRVPESYKLIPSEGVYMANFDFAGKSFLSMVSIGRRPTLESHGKLSIEAHVLDFNDDLYGAVVSVYLLKKLRDNIRFENLDALKSQLQLDLQATKEFFNKLS